MSEVNLIALSKPAATTECYTPGDLIAYTARVSNPSNQNNTKTASRLLKYLIREQHWSPFEMVHMTLEIKTTRDIARQILRHRSFSFQEFSQRYAEAPGFETLQQFIDKGDGHIGFPEQGHGFQVNHGVTHRPEIFAELQKHTKEDLVHYFGASNNSLTSYYPPGGYVGWHTNWNAFGFQCILTWSESGDGYFRWYDKKNDEFVTEEDVPGWQARYYRFGEYHEPEHHLWHAAWTECPRFTLAFKWIYPMIHEGVDIPIANSERVEQARQAQQMFIEELELDI